VFEQGISFGEHNRRLSKFHMENDPNAAKKSADFAERMDATDAGDY
jgi:hypothetical protein